MKSPCTTLAAYVADIMERKGLTVRDVEKRSGNRISNGYVARIIKGKAKNLTTGAIAALADGLDESAEKIFAIAVSRYVPTNLPVRDTILVKIQEKLHQMSTEMQQRYRASLEIIYGDMEKHVELIQKKRKKRA